MKFEAGTSHSFIFLVKLLLKTASSKHQDRPITEKSNDKILAYGYTPVFFLIIDPICSVEDYLTFEFCAQCGSPLSQVSPLAGELSLSLILQQCSTSRNDMKSIDAIIIWLQHLSKYLNHFKD